MPSRLFILLERHIDKLFVIKISRHTYYTCHLQVHVICTFTLVVTHRAKRKNATAMDVIGKFLC